MLSSRALALENLAVALAQGARLELHLTPKPGLVDRVDCGSHADLSFALMERSIGLLTIYFSDLVASLVAGEPFACQQRLAVEAEQRMFAALSTNTHKGYIFLAGMLLIARWHARGSDEGALRAALADISTRFFARAGEGEGSSHGDIARRRFRTGGIVREAIDAYPAVFATALPAFRAAVAAGRDFESASFAMLARLMQCVDDTTTLHRGGAAGLVRVKADGADLERLLASGADAHSMLSDLNRRYVAQRLTIGGIADMLGVSYACLIANGEISADCYAARRKQVLTT